MAWSGECGETVDGVESPGLGLAKAFNSRSAACAELRLVWESPPALCCNTMS